MNPTFQVPVVVISAAASGAGKTLWLEALTRELSDRHLRVGVVKHHPHGTGEAADGVKDTARAARAGAVVRLLAEPAAMHVFTREQPAQSLLEDSVRVIVATTAVDLVLAEGFREVPCRVRLWVGGGGRGARDRVRLHVEARDHADPSRVAAVADRILACEP